MFFKAANCGPDMISNWVLLDSGCLFVVWMTGPLKRIEEAGLARPCISFCWQTLLFLLAWFALCVWLIGHELEASWWLLIEACIGSDLSFPDAHWSVRTKQRKNLWTAMPAINSSCRFKQNLKMTVSQNGCRISTTEPNHILASFFSEDNVLSDEIKICYISEFQSN